ncbi:MAG: BrnT family toxin [Planctomycetes bacterium]|nr:BrnT family toxin [Planctomycetota bacterium]
MRRLRPIPASPEILEKIEDKHGIDFQEVEQIFAATHVVLRGPTDQYGERRYTSLGRTAGGRYLLVVYTVPQPGLAKVITARDMMPRERHYYLRWTSQRKGQ